MSNSGGGTLTWAASNNQAWLSHSFTNTSVSVSASAVGLNAGTYTGAIMLWSDTATNAPKTIPVTLTVTAPATPKIGLSPSALSFAATAGGSNPAAQAITVSNAGTGTLSWTVSDSASWLTATQAGSTVAATVDVTGLAAGTYNTVITVAATGAVNTPQTVPVSLTVTAPKVSTPSLATNPSSLAFTLITGTSATTPQTIAVSNSGGGTLTWAASNNQAWLSHSFTNTSVSVSASAVGLSVGTYTGAIMLWSDTAANAPKTIPVTLTVTAPATPKIGLSPPALSFAATAGGSNPAAQAITVSNAGTGTLSWTVSDSASWLTATQAGSTVAATVDVTGLAAGTYNAVITVAASGAVNTPQTVPVSLTVTAPKVSTPSLATSPSSLAFTLVSGTSATTPQTIAVSNSGGGTLTWAASNNQAWLSHSFTNTSVSVSASAVSLSMGTYTGAIMLWSDTATNAPKTIPVTLTVTAPATTPKIGLSPSALSFAATAGGSNPAAQAITVSNAGTGTLSWTVSDSASWLTATQAGSTVAATVDVTGLAAGTYNAVITVAASGAVNTPQTVPVSLTVATPAVSTPSLATSPSSVAFTLVSGTSATTPQTIAVSNSGGGTLTWAASSNQAWLSHSFTNTSVSVSASAVGLNAGTYTGAIMLWSDTATNAPKTIPVTLTVTAPTNPVIGFSPTTLAFSATTTGSNPTNQSITISNTGAGTLSWSVTDNASWLTATQSGNTVVASVNKTGLTAGTYSALITVSASGATNTPQSIPVSLTVTQSIVNQSVTLSWNANSEGDLAGYKIYRATSSGAYGAPIATIQGTTSYTATGLMAGTTYYFVITAYDNAGNESGRSNEVSKSIY